MNRTVRNLVMAGGFIVGAYFTAKKIAVSYSEDDSIDDGNEYLTKIGNPKNEDVKNKNRYITMVKPTLDRILSFGGLVLLAPVMGVVALAVYIDDPGPVFFTQKRVGKGGHYFLLHKFRSMKISTPHDIPTHQLPAPEKYITRVGRVLRRTSLDELPQIWDIFRQRMSVIGPRPALWNQVDLVVERAKWGANDVLPGLTGLAQIKGRDKLKIIDKAKLDGEYVKVLRKGGFEAFAQDYQLFMGTVASVIKHDGVVEGGTGSLANSSDDLQIHRISGLISVNLEDVGFEDYGYLKHFDIDKSKQISILVTGAGSYIGESFKSYCESHYPNIECTTIDMVDGKWRTYPFQTKDDVPYDAVFHVAGIAHTDVGNTLCEIQDKYYEINTDLAIEVADKSRRAGVKQFIFMSSIIIYGETECVKKTTMPHPTNFYGDSKWRGDAGIRKLASEDFRVAVLRPPMVYGRGSKGNYSILSKIARRVPIFPAVENKRSMLYIENLCEFVALLALSGEGGVYFPQNAEYSNTSEMVRSIGNVNESKVWLSRVLNPAVWLAQHIPIKKFRDLAGKAFGNIWCERALSVYDGLDYQLVGLEESIRRTEG